MVNTDRYVVDRSSYDSLCSHYLLQQANDETISYREQKKRRHLSFLLHGFEIDRKKVLNQSKRTVSPTQFLRTLGKLPRKVKAKPERILEAPSIINDFYTSGLDWGYHDTLAVALDTSVYTWNTKTNKTQLLVEYPTYDNAYISCVAWKPRTTDLAVTNTCTEYIDLWHEQEERLIQKLRTHMHQVIAMCWNGNLLSCGTIGGNILHYDVRTHSDYPTAITREGDVVCGLKWSPNGRYLASGSNNTVKIWDFRQLDAKRPLVNNQCHLSAVKAIAWCPWEPTLLATGGGICDQTVRLWNSMNGKEKCHVKTDSQVTSILWELVTSHGKQDCSLKMWEYPRLHLIEELKIHQERILSAVLSPDQTCVAAASADETISIWNCFPRDKKRKARQVGSGSSLEFAMFNTIR
ncbi:hypothetical protein M8J76_000965 [Diaphorina citri]|nr:hypothetical protein M8J76_000965 [Diaphorina citri]